MNPKIYKTREWSDTRSTNDDLVITHPTEVVRISHKFFDKPPYKQRAVLRLLIWWSVKHYFKILFK